MRRLRVKPLWRRIRIGNMAVPVWALVSGVLVVPAAAGQAVGPVLSGSVTGTGNVTVGQAVTLDLRIPPGANPGFGNQNATLNEVNEPSDGLSTRNEDGTSFMVALEVVAGQRVNVNIYLANNSGVDAAVLLEMNVPTGLNVGLADIDRPGEGGSNVNGTGGAIAANVVREGRTSAANWLLLVGAAAGTGEDDGVTFMVQPRADISPGFYVITGRLSQIGGRPAPAAAATGPTTPAPAAPTAPASEAAAPASTGLPSATSPAPAPAAASATGGVALAPSVPAAP